MRKILNILSSGPILAGAAFILYIQTLAPGVWGFDSAELATGVFTWGIVHPPGYPLYLIIGKIFAFLVPIKDLAYRLNLMSAFFAAITVYLVYLVIQQVTGKRLAAWVGAGFFAVSNQFWQMAIVAEVYTLHTFFLALNLLLVLHWHKTGHWRFIYAFAFSFGLSLANHTTGLLFAPGFLLLILSTSTTFLSNWRKWLLASFFFLLGLIPYIYLPLRTLANPELDYVKAYYGIDLTTLKGIFWMVSGQAYRFFAFGYPLSEVFNEGVRFIGLLWRNYFGIGVLLGVIGFTWKWSKKWKLNIGLLLIFLGNTIFFINYRVLDKDTMFLPAYLVWAIWAGEGISYLSAGLFSIMKDYPFRLVTEKIVLVSMVLAVILGASMNYRWLDMSRNFGKQGVALEVLETASPNSTIIAQWSSAVMLEYYQTVEGLRTDLKIINRSRVDVALYYKYWSQGWKPEEILRLISQNDLQMVYAEIKHRTVYVIEYDPLFLSGFEYLPQGNYYKLSLLDKIEPAP